MLHGGHGGVLQGIGGASWLLSFDHICVAASRLFFYCMSNVQVIID
jgi:hypothetical protein